MRDEWDVPEVGKIYRDVMPDSATKNKWFECIEINSGRFIMKQVRTGKTGTYGPFDWKFVK